MSPSDDPRPGKRLVLSDLSAFKRFQADQMTDHAAALTYYSLLSLFPALLFGVAALGYFGGQRLISAPPTTSCRRARRGDGSTP